jgi:CRISPR-associated protein (TIGR02710 family)
MLDIKEIIEAFISWERFDHKNALSHFNKVKLQNVSKQQSYLGNLTAERGRVGARFSSINRTLQGQVPTTYLITDVFQNARRRSQEGNFDDAVARLYRCLEMVVQYTLLDQYGLVSSDIDLQKLESISIDKNHDEKTWNTLLQKLSNKKNERQKVEVGLVEGFEILFALNREHPVSKQYSSNAENLMESLSFRNRSILAHGIVPVNKDKYEEMDKIVANFVQRLVPDIEDRLRELDMCFEADILL